MPLSLGSAESGSRSADAQVDLKSKDENPVIYIKPVLDIKPVIDFIPVLKINPVTDINPVINLEGRQCQLSLWLVRKAVSGNQPVP